MTTKTQQSIIQNVQYHPTGRYHHATAPVSFHTKSVKDVFIDNCFFKFLISFLCHITMVMYSIISFSKLNSPWRMDWTFLGWCVICVEKEGYQKRKILTIHCLLSSRMLRHQKTTRSRNMGLTCIIYDERILRLWGGKWGSFLLFCF